MRFNDVYRFGNRGRAFLLGSGPSLNKMDLSVLQGEFVCLVNRGMRAVPHLVPHVDMHVVNDIHCYRDFGFEIEQMARSLEVKHRFLNSRMRLRWRLVHRLTKPIAQPIFTTNNAAKLSEFDVAPHFEDGVVSGGSVLLSAATLLSHMGFSDVYILGCDLDYQTAAPYFSQSTQTTPSMSLTRLSLNAGWD